MKKIIFIFVFLFLLSFVSANTYYELNINYNSGNFSLNSVDVATERYSKELYFGSYSGEIYDVTKENIYNFYFYFSNEIYVEDFVNSPKVEELDEFNFTIFVPYQEDGAYLVLRDEYLNEILKFELIEYTKGISSEEAKVFSLDSDFVLDLEKENKSEGEKIVDYYNEEEEKKIMDYWWMLLIILLLLIILFIKLFFFEKK